MNLGRVIMAILLLTILSGCHIDDNPDLIEVDEILTGESDHWILEYKVNGYYEFYNDVEGRLMIRDDGNQQLSVIYKGAIEELESMRKLDVEYPNRSNSDIISVPPETTTFNYESSISRDTLVKIHEGKRIEIIVTWDGDNGASEVITVN